MLLRARLALALLSLLEMALPVRAQLPPSDKLVINQTGIQGGTNGQCLFISSAKLGSQACGGSGTVTSVSVTTANGVSGSVATATTTPAITLTLGAITPTTVNGNTITTGTGTLTLGSVTLNAGAGGTLGSNAFTSTAYAPIASPTFTGTVTIPNGGVFGTPTSLTLTNATGLPISTGVTGAGTGVLTALAVNVGSAGAFVTFNGALGTPSSGVGTNITNVNAATLGGATFAAPGAIGGGTPAAITGTTITGNTSVTSVFFNATGAPGYQLSGASVLNIISAFTTLSDPTGTNKIFIGNATASNANSYLADTHTFANAANNANFLVANSTGSTLNAQIFMPNITTSSAAQTGTVCWTTGTGKFTVDTTVGCLTSIMGAKNITERLSPSKALRIVERLDPFAFRYRPGYGDGGHYEQFGFGAEEVALVDERLVGRDSEGTLSGVRYQEMTAVLAGAIQQIKADSDKLAARLVKMESDK